MVGPCLKHFPVEAACYLQSLLVGLFVSLRVVGCRVELFRAVGCCDQMQHSVIPLAELLACVSHPACQLLPHLWRYVCRDVHCSAVADDDAWLVFLHSLCQTHDTVLKSQLCLQDNQFSLIVEVLVVGEVAPS